MGIGSLHIPDYKGSLAGSTWATGQKDLDRRSLRPSRYHVEGDVANVCQGLSIYLTQLAYLCWC